MTSDENSVKDETPGKIRYGVVGLGYISQGAMLPAFKNAKENSELTALISGDPEKLKELSKKYRVKHTYSYEQYDECLRSKQIDAVYIAEPNHLHLKYAEAALKAGIHVLCEKPMAVNVEECRSMIAASESAGTKLMIAYRLHFERANLKAIAVATCGRMGETRVFNSIFSQQVKPGDVRLMSEDQGGGPLYDMGVYCINAARYIFRAEPEEVFAASASANDGRFQKSPEMLSAVMRFPENRLATFTCSFGAADSSAYEVLGTKGTLRLEGAYDMRGKKTLAAVIEEEHEDETFSSKDQFGPELIYFSDCILKQKTPEPSGYEGLADVQIVNALRESAKNGRPVRVGEIRNTKYPSPDQEISKPEVKKPEMVKAASPTGE